MKNRQGKVISILLAILMVLPFMPIEANAVGVSAESAITIDHDTGDVFYAKNADKMMVPASMTKILTTYIIYEEIAAGNLTKNTMIKVSPKAARMSRDRGYPMAVPLQSGASYSVDQFIKLIMIPSASASCYAMAEHISGSEAAFVQRMNKTAKELGMKADFKNSHGAKPHYTTARSVATLVSHFIDTFPDILNYTSMPSISFNGRNYRIFNELISRTPYKGADGFKTGTIAQAGYCLAATAKRDGRRIITVIMKSSSNAIRYNDARALLDNGFAELNKADKQRANTKLNIIDKPNEIRLNSNFTVKARPNNITRNYHSTGGWTLDGEVVKTFGKNLFHNNKVMELTHYVNDANKNNVKIGFYLDLPEGGKKEVETTINISDQEPALYRDIEGNWAAQAIIDLTNKGILNGTKDNKFGISNEVNKGDFLTALGRVVEYLELDTIENKDSTFNDVKTSDYFNKYAAWAEDKNIIQGYQNKFQPSKSITREEVAIILNNLAKAYELELDKNNSIQFNDLHTVNSWAKESVNTIIKTDLINYGEDGKFRPLNKVYRTDMAYILNQTLEMFQTTTD